LTVVFGGTVIDTESPFPLLMLMTLVALEAVLIRAGPPAGIGEGLTVIMDVRVTVRHAK